MNTPTGEKDFEWDDVTPPQSSTKFYIRKKKKYGMVRSHKRIVNGKEVEVRPYLRKLPKKENLNK